MTISNTERERDISFALKQVMELIGSRFLGDVLLNPTTAELGRVLRTTWEELRAQSFVENAPTPIGCETWYRLTGRGWIEYLNRTGQRPTMRDNLENLRKAIKAHAKKNNRQWEEPVYLLSIAQSAHVPFEWAANVIEAQLLDDEWPKDRVHVTWWSPTEKLKHGLIRIPVDFGQERLGKKPNPKST